MNRLHKMIMALPKVLSKENKVDVVIAMLE